MCGVLAGYAKGIGVEGAGEYSEAARPIGDVILFKQVKPRRHRELRASPNTDPGARLSGGRRPLCAAMVRSDSRKLGKNSPPQLRWKPTPKSSQRSWKRFLLLSKSENEPCPCHKIDLASENIPQRLDNPTLIIEYDSEGLEWPAHLRNSCRKQATLTMSAAHALFGRTDPCLGRRYCLHR